MTLTHKFSRLDLHIKDHKLNMEQYAVKAVMHLRLQTKREKKKKKKKKWRKIQ